MSILHSELVSSVDSEIVCRICQNDFEPPYVESIYCEKCEGWVHLDCSEISRHDFNFYCKNKDPFYCKVCVNEFKLDLIKFDDYCKICYKRFSSVDDCLFCESCCRWVHLKCTTLSNKGFDEMCKNCLPFYCNVCTPKMSLCCKCQLVCANTKRYFTCFLCYQKCHVECVSIQNKNIKNHIKKGNFKYYCDNCKKSVFPFQNVDNLDYDCFHKSDKLNVLKIKDKCYLDVNSVKFGKENIISVVYMNIRSLNANLYKIEEFLSIVENLPDVICVCETWLTSLRPFIGKLQGYDFVNKISNSNQSGGVAFFIKDCHTYEIVEDVCFSQCDVDDLWIKFKLESNKSMIVGNLYRHPSSSFTLFQENFLRVLDSLNDKNKDFIIGGDININLLKCDQRTSDYLDCISCAGVRQVVNSPTRCSSDFSLSSLIDHVYTNFRCGKLNVNVVNFDISDHMPVVCEISCVKSKKGVCYQKSVQDFSKFDVGVFLNNLNVNLEKMRLSITNFEDVNVCWSKFESVFSSTVFNNAPIKILSKKEQKLKAKPWITKGIINSIKNKNIMFKFAIKDKTKKFSVSFKKYRNLLNRVIECSKRLYFKQVVKNNKTNSKKLWKIINNIVTTKSTSHSKINGVLDVYGKFVDEPKEVGNLMNKKFVSIADDLIKERMDVVQKYDEFGFHSVNTDFVFKKISESEIENYIKSMNPNKSVRSDVPSIRFVKLSAKIIAPYLAKLYNKCVEYGVFPESLKYAEVVPIYKTGKKNDVNNYRPISLLSPFSKIFESLVCERLNDYFLSNEILHCKQYGFRKNSTTELAVNQIVEDLIEAGEKKLINCSVFLDLAKAFNTVNHKILLSKLKGYNIKCSMLNFIESYLKDRSQSTVINNVVSEREILNVGIPQGSCLGPLLFLVYINDIFSATEVKLRLFADDACLSYQHSDPDFVNSVVNRELSKIDVWLRANKLFINYSKTKFLLFNRTAKKCDFNVMVNGFVIEQSESVKYLGVVLDDKLNWRAHLKSLKSKLSRSCFVMSKLRYYLDTDTLKMVYYSLFYPHIQYCISAWGGAADCHLKPIVCMQKRVVRYVCRVPALTPTNPLFIKTGFLKLNEVLKLQICKLMQNTIRGFEVDHNCFTPVSSLHSHNTRFSKKSNFILERPRTLLGLSSFRYLGPKLWSSVPENIKNLKKDEFKYQYKKFLLSCYGE